MAKGKRGTDGTGEAAQAVTTAPEGATGAASEEQREQSRVYNVLAEGLRKVDDLADYMRAALLDMDTGVRPPTHTGHHLNHTGKLIQLMKMKDQARAKVAKATGDPLAVPGSARKLA